MTKTETIWQIIINKALKEHVFKSTQKELAEKTGFSLSTVHAALQKPSDIGAIRQSTKFFVLEDIFKFLYFWGSNRGLKADTISSLHVDMPVQQIEASMPPNVVFACYSAAKFHLSGNVPADYAKVYIYIEDEKIIDIKKRFGEKVADSKRIEPNLFMLKRRDYMVFDNGITTLSNTFVDIWNLPDWYAKDFIKALEEEINGILS